MLEITQAAQEFVLRPADSVPSLVEIDGILVHQGVPHAGFLIVKAGTDDREQHFRHLSGIE